jgi:glycerol kinase
LANLLKTNVINIGLEEVSALGAACLAGLQQNIFADLAQLKKLATDKKKFSPNKDMKNVQAYYEGWKKAVERLL